jgi:hypothetical protein
MVSDQDVAEMMLVNLKFAEELANKIFREAENDGKDAFLKAVGTLSHVIYVTIEEDRREDILAKLPGIVGEYLAMLDAAHDNGLANERPH